MTNIEQRMTNRENEREAATTGLFIVFEGIDGAGKSTQVRRLAAALRAAGLAVTTSKEPTDGPWGRKLRASASTGRLSLEEELDAFAKDRKQHVRELIRPALARGEVVILDRYYYSTIAYQGARGADIDHIARTMQAFAPEPDLVLLLDLPPEVALQRIERGRGELPNHFERAEALARSRKLFLDQARRRPNFRVLDAGRLGEDALHRAIIRLVAQALPEDRAAHLHEHTP